MKLVVPHTGELEGADARLIRLASFLGIACEQLFLDKDNRHPGEYLLARIPDDTSCLLVNPRVLKNWTGGVVSADVVNNLTVRCPYLFVHCLTAEDSFEKSLITMLSAGHVNSGRRVGDAGKRYEFSCNSREICGVFSGLSFGPVNPANDLVLSVSRDDTDVSSAIYIAGKPFMSLMMRGRAKIIVLASADVLDVNDETSDTNLGECFSRIVPQAMALRYVFGEHCWRPCGHYASFIIDDPLLRPRYGHLDYGSLLNLMKEYRFSSTIAFIPHNYRRNSWRTVRMFHESRGRLAICFHGNDHTAGEFAATDPTRLNTMIRTAEVRMDSHTSATGLPCPKVMVFPQDEFSSEAMKVLKSHNFCAAVCGTAHPVGGRVNFTLGERVQPAILRHGKFPLFLRKFIGQVKKEDVAFNLFFGQPVLVTDHHGLFEHVRSLVDDVLMINSIDPAIQWSDLGTAVLNSNLRRRMVDGVSHIRAYSGTVRITNDSDAVKRFLVEWTYSSECPAIEQVLQNSAPVPSFTVGNSAIGVSVELPPGSTQILSVAYRNNYSNLARLGFLWDAKAFTRRRLSEARDNYISKNNLAMAVGQTLKRRVLSRIL
jgi:hypothetical protein